MDSKIAINRVIFVVSKDHRPTKQPDNTDYLSVIQDLHKELRRPLKIQWIKGHQDDKSSYEKLPPDTKSNIDVDRLATAFHHRPRSKPLPTTEHIDSTKISVTINNSRYASNIDGNLRFQINGGYIRRYLQAKHGWSNPTWDTINLPAFGRHLKTLSLPHHTAHIKFVHDKQPLGVHQYRLSNVKDRAISLCPCCQETEEDQHHFLHCSKNPSREDSVKLLLQTLIGTDNHPYGVSIAAGLDQHLAAPERPVDIQHQTHPSHFHSATTEASLQQQQIGWHHLLHGYMAMAWLTLASTSPINSPKPDLKRGNYRIHKTLQALHQFTRSLWLSRNEVLHKHQDSITSVRYSAESSEIRHYFDNPLLLPAEDRHYCASNLDKLLQGGRPSLRRRWLRRVRRARANMIKHGQSQTTLHTFFRPTQRQDPEAQPRLNVPQLHGTTLHGISTQPPIPQTIDRIPGRPPDEDNGTLPATKRTHTTQQRMTAFFPGRPPDLPPRQPEPGNPPHV